MLLFFRASDHRLCHHDALAHGALRPAGGRRFPQTGDDDLCAGSPGLRCIHPVCFRPLFPLQVPGNRRIPGTGRLPAHAAPNAVPGIGGNLPGLLRRRRAPGHTAGLGAVADFPPVRGGYPGNGPVVRPAGLSDRPGLFTVCHPDALFLRLPLYPPHQYHRHRQRVPEIGAHPRCPALVRLGRHSADGRRRPSGIFGARLLCHGPALVSAGRLQRHFLRAAGGRPLHGSAAHGGQRLEPPREGPLSQHHFHQHDEIPGQADGTQYAGHNRAHRRFLLRGVLHAHAGHRFRHELPAAADGLRLSLAGRSGYPRGGGGSRSGRAVRRNHYLLGPGSHDPAGYRRL